MVRLSLSLLVLSLTFFLYSCENPQPGPDKTVTGAVLGAGWGAGAGAVVGNQVSNTGEGAAVGAGFGFVSGALTGTGYDLHEDVQIEQEKELASLKIANMANQRELAKIQEHLDHLATTEQAGGVYQVFFDEDATSLRAGATANLEVIARAIQKSPSAHKVKVVGHTDNAGSNTYNDKVALERATSVSAYLTSRGISSDQVIVESHGSKRPMATNSTPTGRQLNRRVDVYVVADR